MPIMTDRQRIQDSLVRSAAAGPTMPQQPAAAMTPATAFLTKLRTSVHCLAAFMPAYSLTSPGSRQGR